MAFASNKASTPQRAWCFTLNNYSDADLEVLAKLDVDYLVCGKEIGEVCQTPHLQGYLYSKAKKSFKQVCAIFQRAHWEPSRGSIKSNYDYCTKSGNFIEIGKKPLDPSEKGSKGKIKIAEMWEHAKRGEFECLPPGGIKQWEYIFAKYGDAPRDRGELDNVWIWGPTGVGKSKYVRDTYPTFYSKNMSKWWDGYANEDVVVLDDFAPEHAKYLGYYLKIWADHYVFNAEVKGGMLRIRPKRVIVTSQYSLSACFQDDGETLSAISRRFKEMHLKPSLYSLIN